MKVSASMMRFAKSKGVTKSPTEKIANVRVMESGISTLPSRTGNLARKCWKASNVSVSTIAISLSP